MGGCFTDPRLTQVTIIQDSSPEGLGLAPAISRVASNLKLNNRHDIIRFPHVFVANLSSLLLLLLVLSHSKNALFVFVA
jgi:hypothetical protein